MNPTTTHPSAPGHRINNRQAIGILLVLAVVAALAATAFDALTGTDTPAGEDIRYTSGTGWAAAHGDSGGWRCGDSGQAVVCSGGTGPTRVAPGMKGKMAMAAEWQQGILVRYDPALWGCIRTNGQVTCLAR